LGGIGLLQTPTARTAAPPLRIPRGLVPYTTGNVFVHPFDWLETGFRYTNISNRLYEPAELSGNQANKDKGFDAKIRLTKESAYVPQLAVGIRDLAGTGLFSGEYVVGSKRTGPLDWSLGLGWGNVGGRGDLRNPLPQPFRYPATDVGQGGNVSFAISGARPPFSAGCSTRRRGSV
jgi:hypothetical protein